MTIPSRPSQHDKHFPTPNETLKVPQNINANLLSTPKNPLEPAKSLQQNIRDSGLIIHSSSIPKDIQISKRHASTPTWIPIRITRTNIQHILHPSPRVEIIRMRIQVWPTTGIKKSVYTPTAEFTGDSRELLRNTRETASHVDNDILVFLADVIFQQVAGGIGTLCFALAVVDRGWGFVYALFYRT